MNVSVIIAAHNAEDTIAETLQSLLNQSFPHWEAIVVDDGSSDGTENVVKGFVERDARFRLLKQQQMGVSIARNNGIKLARSDWLVFLDSDDWIFPSHLERLTGLIEADPTLDVAYCGWAYFTPDGERVFEEFYGKTGDLFADYTASCVSVLHTYIVRRSLVIAVGGFDPTYRTCEDWDLFQRIARTGARFGGIGETLAAYRMRPGSATCNSLQLLKDGIRVLNQGHAPDPRLAQLHIPYPEGLPKEQLIKNKFDLLSACAGYAIGSGYDARPLLEELKGEKCLTLNPNEAANCIFRHAMVSASRPRSEWYKLWTGFEDKVKDFLDALEAHTGTPGLAGHALWFSKNLVMRYAKDPGLGRRLGSLQAHLILCISSSIKETARRLHKAKQILKRSSRVALLMIPELKHISKNMRGLLKPRKKENPALSREKSNPKAHFEELFSKSPDPWNYTNPYEQTKYEQTLSLIPDEPIEKALELACAEGHFTVQLAPRVKHLLAADISQIALRRAADRCNNLKNVAFQCLDITKDPIPGQFDLIVCSEVLYFVGDQKKLRTTAEKLANCLNPGGYLLMAHANLIVDEPNQPGFNWDHAFGGKVIGETFARHHNLEFRKELRTPLYRIQLFQRKDHINFFSRNCAPKAIELAQHGPLPSKVATQVLWNTDKLPILIYRRVGPIKSDTQNYSTVTPEAFEEQLCYLRDTDHESISLYEWLYAVHSKTPLTGRKVVITFDEGCQDFLTYAWPLLKRYGFSAVVFLITGQIVRSNSQHQNHQKEVTPLSWKEIRQLQSEGITFGSYSVSHPDLTSISLKKALWEIRRSRATLERELGTYISYFAYPYGKFNRLIEYLVGISGYDFGLSSEPGLCTMSHSLLALPRIEVKGSDSIEDFAAKLWDISPDKKA
ncbi:MAG TPA: trifunctional glycosyltransferase/class I SAM-dependent methyltransferase/polysaccharide deacetylase [Thermodesulfobacteriota bacterium]|nr:trifunctional glycosyltransferase/class I SAM-dependent methyltransferase/polysaccharide deacetylase [Thermodesulfobacteriota bacterium]